MRVSYLIYFISSLIIFADCVPTPEPPLTVVLKNGLVKGEWKNSLRTYAEFINIPYAKPPVGKLRFRAPQPAEPWTEPVGGPQPINYCPQLYSIFIAHDDGTEDCLYLNVYTPQPDTNASLPVLVYVHGGGFIKQSGLQYDPKYLMEQDMVVVTFNYRLGVFGFLSTGDDVAPGNAGLKDQVMALRWVQENIRAFGGDPDSVTIAGSDAGAASVHYHYLSKMSRGLFARGIAMGGSAFSPWAYSTKPRSKTVNLANLFNCTTESSQEIVDCLRSYDAVHLLFGQVGINDYEIEQFSLFGPTVEMPAEGAFLTEYPYEATKSGAMYDVPLLASVTKDEGLRPPGPFPITGNWYRERDMVTIEEIWDYGAHSLFYYNDTLPEEQRLDVATKIRKQYFAAKGGSKNITYEDFVQALGDRLYTAGVGKLVELHAAASTSPVYLYKFNFEANKHTPHESDLMHIFYTGSSNDTDEDVSMSKTLVKMVYSYCKGETPKLSIVPEWTPVSPGKPLSYLEISSPTSFELKTETDFGLRSFWDSLQLNEGQHFKKEQL